ncbi:hypothetical protein AGOR_G00250170 [Albula goreensis]|uniref:Uncharacterized protein n=1 Tax=Albula goreensis TaxID=1534307 RepID=A0A8T3CI18_9TELE|nr:hypothetical protein AGOR_G00250170 [Albula goreensis]
MSSSLPKSESATSLLKSSAPNRRSAHHRPENSASSRRSQHQRPAAQRGGRDDEETCWPDECEASARRPLCHPRLSNNRNGGDRRGSKGPSHQAHAPLDHEYSQEELLERQGTGRDDRARSKQSRHPHHHQHKPSRRDPPRVHHSNLSSAVPPSPTPSLSRSADEAAFFFESKDRTRTGSSLSLASDPPASSSPLPAAAAASRRTSNSHGKSTRASTEFDSDLHPIVKSVFGQVQSYAWV